LETQASHFRKMTKRVIADGATITVKEMDRRSEFHEYSSALALWSACKSFSQWQLTLQDWSIRVPFWSIHHSGRAHGGCVPSGSSPASLSNRATTPWAGTLGTVTLRTAVPLLVWAHKSCAPVTQFQLSNDSGWSWNLRERCTAYRHESRETLSSWRSYLLVHRGHWAMLGTRPISESSNDWLNKPSRTEYAVMK
jgi:hypothetical protein